MPAKTRRKKRGLLRIGMMSALDTFGLFALCRVETGTKTKSDSRMKGWLLCEERTYVAILKVLFALACLLLQCSTRFWA